jgi:hypothetical protein
VERDPQHPVRAGQPGPVRLALEHAELVAQCDCRASLPLVIPRPDRTGLRARWIAWGGERFRWR